jgi:hypothetical protein
MTLSLYCLLLKLEKLGFVKCAPIFAAVFKLAPLSSVLCKFAPLSAAICKFAPLSAAVYIFAQLSAALCKFAPLSAELRKFAPLSAALCKLRLTASSVQYNVGKMHLRRTQQRVLLKHWYTYTNIHGVISHNKILLYSGKGLWLSRQV